MMSTLVLRVKSISYAALCGLALSLPASDVLAAKATSKAPAAQAAKDPRAGLPASYTGPTTAVAAVVNDKVITTYDVAQRLRLMLLSSGGRVPPQAIPQLQQRALRDLNEDKLKLADGEKWKVDLDPKELDEEYFGMGAQSGLNPVQFEQVLKQEGIDTESLKEQVRARIVWQKIITGRFRSRVKVNENEINEQLE
ncbi:MAG: SurA N-terminal domain-containing protein, partial [Parvularculaceae bacterium]|nr:SurA N-terminal domain-containing protein [Parvularculaceae bacterium]